MVPINLRLDPTSLGGLLVLSLRTLILRRKSLTRGIPLAEYTAASIPPPLPPALLKSANFISHDDSSAYVPVLHIFDDETAFYAHGKILPVAQAHYYMLKS